MPIANNGLNLKIPEFPIVKKIEETELGKIVVTIELDFKMLNGIYTAEIEIVEQQPYEHIRLRAYHKSGLGRLAIDLNITIERFVRVSQLRWIIRKLEWMLCS